MGEPADQFRYPLSEQIRTHAMSFPETEEGTSCVNRAFKAGGKNFVFLGEKDDECNMRLKLDASIPEIQERAKDQARQWDVGKGGWAMLRFDPEHPPPAEDLERWVTESFLLLAPKKLSKLIDQ